MPDGRKKENLLLPIIARKFNQAGFVAFGLSSRQHARQLNFVDMYTFEINLMVDIENLIWKIDTFAIEKLVLAHEASSSFIDRDTSVIVVCRKDWQKFKQFDHWTRKGMACYSVILPYETCLADQTNKDDLTVLGADLVVECLRQWAEKRRQKALKARPKKAA